MVKQYYSMAAVCELMKLKRVNIMDYLRRGVISKAIKNGYRVYFTDQHLAELNNLKKLTTLGVSQKHNLKLLKQGKVVSRDGSLTIILER
jgi:DNA-binding transcriptional MerR regulator